MSNGHHFAWCKADAGADCDAGVPFGQTPPPARRAILGGMSAASKLFDEALHLPVGERAELASRLLRSLDDDEPAEDPAGVEDAWAAEIERRIADREAGRAGSVPLDQAIADVRAELAAARKAKTR